MNWAAVIRELVNQLKKLKPVKKLFLVIFITFWKREFHLVLVMRDILSTWKIEIFPRFEQTQFFSQRGSKRCVYIWLGERCCLVFMNR